MIEKLQSIINNYNELSETLSDPNVIADGKKYAANLIIAHGNILNNRY